MEFGVGGKLCGPPCPSAQILHCVGIAGVTPENLAEMCSAQH